MRKWLMRIALGVVAVYLIGVVVILFMLHNPGQCVQSSFAFGWPFFFIIGHLHLHVQMLDDFAVRYIGWFFDFCGVGK